MRAARLERSDEPSLSGAARIARQHALRSCSRTCMTRGGGSIRPDGLYHIISRFVGNEWFMATDLERHAYRALLGFYVPQTDWSLLAYALMSSHIHLAVIAGRMSLATWMRPMHSEFAGWLNSRLDRIGGMFVKGPNVGEVRRDGAAPLLHYIHGNPVRAGVIARPEDSDWTSHGAYVGTARQPDWLDVETGLAVAGFGSGDEYAAWAEATRVSKENLQALAVEPSPARGRRPKPAAENAKPA